MVASARKLSHGHINEHTATTGYKNKAVYIQWGVKMWAPLV